MASDTASPTVNRIVALDALRGFALFGVLIANFATFGLASKSDILADLDGWETFFTGQVLVTLFGLLIENRMMGLFSLLFGAGIIMLTERLATREVRPARVYFRRMLILAVLGGLHMTLWMGDILLPYAAAGALVYFLRGLPARVQIALGASILLWAPLLYLGAGIGPGLEDISRMLGMLLLGMGIYRTGMLTGDWSLETYKNLALVAVPLGLAISLLRVTDIGFASSDAGSAAILGLAVPVQMAGYIGLVMWFSLSGKAAGLRDRLAAAGRMSVTNYLSHTVIGTGIYLVAEWTTGERLSPVGFVVAVSAIIAFQLVASPWWLKRFRFGPVEWIWRSGTYGKRQPLRRSPSVEPQRPERIPASVA